MVRKILDDLDENETSEDERNKILSQIEMTLREIFANRGEEASQILQSLRSQTKKSLRPLTTPFLMQNSEEERERRLSEIA